MGISICVDVVRGVMQRAFIVGRTGVRRGLFSVTSVCVWVFRSTNGWVYWGVFGECMHGVFGPSRIFSNLCRSCKFQVHGGGYERDGVSMSRSWP